MKRSIAFLVCLSLFIVNVCYLPMASAEEIISENIASEIEAKKLAAKAGGKYVKDLSTVEFTESQVALPIVDGDTGDILGYIVADQQKLVSVLNAAGLGEVATAVAAVPATAAAGAAAGMTATAGISAGTALAAAATAAAVVGAALAVGKGSGTTSHH